MQIVSHYIYIHTLASEHTREVLFFFLRLIIFIHHNSGLHFSMTKIPTGVMKTQNLKVDKAI